MTIITNQMGKSYRPIQQCHRAKQFTFCRQLFSQDKSYNTRILAEFEAENVQTVILDRQSDRQLLRLLLRSGDWIVDFADRRSVILVQARSEQQPQDGL